MGHIKEESIEKVKHSVNIVEIVNRYVPLKKQDKILQESARFIQTRRLLLMSVPKGRFSSALGAEKQAVFTLL